LTATVDTLSGNVAINCSQNGSTTTCFFVQSVLQALFGDAGFSLSGCVFGECVDQDVIGMPSGTSTSGSEPERLSKAVIGGLAVVGGLLLISIIVLLWGWRRQVMARLQRSSNEHRSTHGFGIMWSNLRYTIRHEFVGQPMGQRNWWRRLNWRQDRQDPEDETMKYKVLLDDISGRVEPGQMMAILGPSGMSHLRL
jgi:hypothetical protein